MLHGTTHEELPVYRHALDVATKLDVVAQALPDRRLDLRDQLARASASIVLNIAEGAAEYSPAEKSKFYRIARRSTGESIAICELVEPKLQGLPECRSDLVAIRSALTALIRRVDERRK